MAKRGSLHENKEDEAQTLLIHCHHGRKDGKHGTVEEEDEKAANIDVDTSMAETDNTESTEDNVNNTINGKKHKKRLKQKENAICIDTKSITKVSSYFNGLLEWHKPIKITTLYSFKRDFELLEESKRLNILKEYNYFLLYLNGNIDENDRFNCIDTSKFEFTRNLVASELDISFNELSAVINYSLHKHFKDYFLTDNNMKDDKILGLSWPFALGTSVNDAFEGSICKSSIAMKSFCQNIARLIGYSRYRPHGGYEVLFAMYIESCIQRPESEQTYSFIEDVLNVYRIARDTHPFRLIWIQQAGIYQFYDKNIKFTAMNLQESYPYYWTNDNESARLRFIPQKSYESIVEKFASIAKARKKSQLRKGDE